MITKVMLAALIIFIIMRIIKFNLCYNIGSCNKNKNGG